MIKRKCLICGVEMEILSCHIRANRHKFCSRKCYLQSRLVDGKPTYVAVHLWLHKNYGKATKCENNNCKKISKRFEWSLLKEKECDKDRNNFWQLCKSCHSYYDIKEDTLKKLSESHKNQKAWHKGKTNVYSKKLLKHWSLVRKGMKISEAQKNRELSNKIFIC
jgi:hypothetical protein